MFILVKPLAKMPFKVESVYSRVRNKKDYLYIYCVIAIAFNFFLLFLKGYDADLGYWESWVRQLSRRGYEGFNGNYPPVYVHWLYFLGMVYEWINIPIDRNQFLKFLTQIPVVFSHIAFIFFLYRALISHKNRGNFHLVMLLATCSPAILINGPIWGQVDLIGPIFVISAILCSVSNRYCAFAIPLYILSLLTKFQMIAFAPVMGYLFFLNIKKNCIGILLGGCLFAIIYLPYLISGYFIEGFRQAYIDTLGQYSMTTFNAANIWMLLTENTVSDDVVLFGIKEGSILATIFTAKYFGMLIFIAISFAVFIRGLVFVVKKVERKEIIEGAFLASTVCSLAFFAFLPAMHERYMFPAVVMSIMYVAVSGRGYIYACLVSFICALNMLVILEIHGSDIWISLSFLVVAASIFSLVDFISSSRVSSMVQRRIRGVMLFQSSLPIFVVVSITLVFAYFNYRYSAVELTLVNNQKFITSLELISAVQDHGRMRVNKNYNGSYLALNGRRYSQGIGTHANSSIQYRLPSGATTFEFIAGLDDSVKKADVRFSVWGDEVKIWESSIHRGFEIYLHTVSLDVDGVEVLDLRVEAMSNDTWDHANWVNTVITFKSESY
jgi:Gpi18-like mannosyltransferase